jgi:uncharacterized protein (DUF305 family)
MSAAIISVRRWRPLPSTAASPTTRTRMPDRRRNHAMHSRFVLPGEKFTVRPILLALSAAVLLAACGQGAASTVDQAATFNDADARFLQDMIPHHEQAVRMATLVDGRTRRPELIKLAARLAATQSGETSTMRRWLARWGTSPVVDATDHAESDVPGMLGRGQLDWLKTLHGGTFDLGFVTMIRTRHVGGIEMAEANFARAPQQRSRHSPRGSSLSRRPSSAKCTLGGMPGRRTRVDQAGRHRRERHAGSPMGHPDLLTPFTGRPPPHLRPRSAPTMAVRTTGILVLSAETHQRECDGRRRGARPRPGARRPARSR